MQFIPVIRRDDKTKGGWSMRNKYVLLLAGAVSLSVAASASAQQTMLTPPKVLVIIREVVKTGKGAAHAKWEAGWPKAFAKAKWPVHYVAASAITGESRALFMVGYDSLAAWEKDTEDQGKNAALSASEEMLADKDGDFLTESRTAVFTYLPELSYQAEVPLAGVRGFTVVTQHVKPGHGKHFEEIRKMVRAAHEKAGLGDHYSVYQARAGAPGGTYLIFVPMKSLAEADQFDTVHGKTYQDALGEDGQKAIMDFNAQGLESGESQYFTFSPKMSYVSKEWMDADKEFWTPKPEPMMKPAAKKEEKKP